MKKISYHLQVFFLFVFVLSSIPAKAQLIIGQYEDEAPFRTWNTFGIQSASAVGMGEAQFALVADSSASVINPARLTANPDYEYGGELLYLLEFAQSGLLRNYNISLARKIGQWFSFGIGVNYVAGSMEKTIVENSYYNGVTISDRKKHDFTGFYVNGGLTADVNEKLTIAAVFRTPYTKKADSESMLRYDSPQGNTDIRHEAAAKNGYKQPLVLGVGVDYRFSPQLRVASDVSYFNWSSYSVTYFGEEIKREFKDIVKVSGGIEYVGSFRLFHQDFQVPLRVGLSYDPQPVKEPSSHYFYYTFGVGVHWQGLHLDAGAMFGNEKGSGSDLYGRKLLITLNYFL